VRGVKKVSTERASVERAATASTARVVDPARGDHYGRMAMQPLDFIVANRLDFVSGNVIKYVTRGALGDDEDRMTLVDLMKARHYLDMMIEHVEKRLGH